MRSRPCRSPSWRSISPISTRARSGAASHSWVLPPKRRCKGLAGGAIPPPCARWLSCSATADDRRGRWSWGDWVIGDGRSFPLLPHHPITASLGELLGGDAVDELIAVLAVGEDGAPDASLQLEAQRFMESG